MTIVRCRNCELWVLVTARWKAMGALIDEATKIVYGYATLRD